MPLASRDLRSRSLHDGQYLMAKARPTRAPWTKRHSSRDMISGEQRLREAPVAINFDQKRHDALRHIESLRSNWSRVGSARPGKEHADIHSHMRWCLEELTSLVRELEADNA